MPNPGQNNFSHFDIVVSNSQVSTGYYSGLFNWHFDEPDSNKYTFIHTAGTPSGDPDGGLWEVEKEIPFDAIPFFFRDSMESFIQNPPPGVTVIASGTHPRGNKRFAVTKGPDNELVGHIER